MENKFIKFAEDYIKAQERFYGRPLSSFDKYLIRDFARKLVDGKMVSKEALARPPEQSQIAFITEDVGHLTGGRYYAWFIATALVELGFEVTVYTNREPVFLEFFREYKSPKLKVIAKSSRELAELDIKADLYIGSPIYGNSAVVRLSEKYQKPGFVIIFDPFPMMEKYLGRRGYVGWDQLIIDLRRNKNIKIISLCNTTSPYIYDWLKKTPNDVFEIYPCINSRELNKVSKAEPENYVVFISRIVKHKNFNQIIQVVKKLGLRLKVISSIDGMGSNKIVKFQEMRKQVDFCFNVNDQEKFEIISKSRAVISASIFEGFGMWAAEAVACGVPLVCYEYPTLREIEEYSGAKNFYFAKYNNPTDLAKKLEQAIKEEKFAGRSEVFDFERMKERVQEVFPLDRTPEPKIGVVTIALNEEQFIKASLKAVARHKNIEKIAVVEGADRLFSHAATEKGLSIDGTEEAVLGAISEVEGNKIIYDRYGWADNKAELRNHALHLLRDTELDYILVVDADEVWTQKNLDLLVEAIKENPIAGMFKFKHLHFYKSKDQIAVGSNWDFYLFRFFRYADKTFKWKAHEKPVINEKGESIEKAGVVVLDHVFVHHFGYLKDVKRVQEKIEYYKKRDSNLSVVDTFTDWKSGKPTSTTHGKGTVERYSGDYPEEVLGII